MKVIIDPKYEKYRKLIRDIPKEKLPISHIFCDNRNLVTLVDIDNDKQWVVKKFKRPTLANCIIYTWFRTNKAERSFKYAYRLLKNNIDTAYPIAYIEIYRHGFFHTGYYISEYLPYKQIDQIDRNDPDYKRDFIKFSRILFQKGIINYDSNPSNILTHKDDKENYIFSLVDINRIHFQKTNWRMHVHAFSQCISFNSTYTNKKNILFQLEMFSQYCIACEVNIVLATLDIYLYNQYCYIINKLHGVLKKVIHIFSIIKWNAHKPLAFFK
jgi:hypothetical protein